MQLNKHDLEIVTEWFNVVRNEFEGIRDLTEDEKTLNKLREVINAA